VPQDGADDRFLYLSDVLPTAWQAVEYADIPVGGSVAVFGLGPVGQMSGRIARQRGARVIGIDLKMTDGRGADAVIDAVGIEAHGSPAAKLAQAATGLLPDAVAAPLMLNFGVDRLAALVQAIETVRRGGTLSILR
jgi:threonine dehydrogenase-like Zn-dependent dehydrogenase